MQVKDFDYSLPPELIAQFPADQRDASRMMVLDRKNGAISDERFKSLSNYLRAGDLLVMNDTRVIPARLFGHKQTGGRVEVFLVRRCAGTDEKWHCLIKGSKGLKEGAVLAMSGGMQASICSRQDQETWIVSFFGEEPFEAWLQREGEMPLPPYLQRPAGKSDSERYQTIMARIPGAVAAPTAGLHFTEALLDTLKAKGIGVATITLHTGLGTFLPVRVERVEEHRIHTEHYHISQETAEAIRQTRQRGGRVLAVGTTTTRTLEYAADGQGGVKTGSGEADIFIYPGYSFKVVDALLTNFHLPESTLIMLVSAFAGKDVILNAYQKAVELRYRFYSYGDAMLIV